ncbi:hypothetical protein [Arthrobacter cavernae]|uniref:Uncharacterized protein n=1 Tax=Arthrobacter cavernae TaxID=2817681 RepID=A0A939HFG4_9MICC|nr:hypothetical protein [Arthrobacter cavernae]MBO1269904.1 hypothetical protein [Arthrobacter cavernae]
MSRLKEKLRTMEASELPILARRRAAVRHFRGTADVVQLLRDHLLLSGAAAMGEEDISDRFGLTVGVGSAEGYAMAGTAETLQAAYGLIEDRDGNVVIREVTVAGAFTGGKVPVAAIALDLLESPATRERSAGRRVIRELLDACERRVREPAALGSSGPPGGWGRPWPQCVEFARALPASQWTLVGGLMVQLHSAVAGLAVTRPTADIDIVLHIETGAATTSSVTSVLRALGDELRVSIDRAAPAHRFVRGEEQIDVMVAEHLAPGNDSRHRRTQAFRVSGDTAALRRTVTCRVTVAGGEPVLISVPHALGALVLKGGCLPGELARCWSSR